MCPSPFYYLLPSSEEEDGLSWMRRGVMISLSLCVRFLASLGSRSSVSVPASTERKLIKKKRRTTLLILEKERLCKTTTQTFLHKKRGLKSDKVTR